MSIAPADVVVKSHLVARVADTVLVVHEAEVELEMIIFGMRIFAPDVGRKPALAGVVVDPILSRPVADINTAFPLSSVVVEG